jgi:hypothetical protein
MPANVFISFASPDRKIATVLCNALETRGFKCWISSRNIRPGENFQVSIVQAIRRARILLLVFTENSNKSEEMTKELALASQQKLIVIPLRVEDVTPNEAFSYEFATRQWIDFFADWEFAMDQLSARISDAIGVPHPAPALAAPELEAAAPPAPRLQPVVEAALPEPEQAAESFAAKHHIPLDIGTDDLPADRPKRTMGRLVLVGAAIAIAIGVGVGLTFSGRTENGAEAKTAILAVGTLAPTPVQAAPAPVAPAVTAEAAAAELAPEEAKPVAKRKRRAEQPKVEEIPY